MEMNNSSSMSAVSASSSAVRSAENQSGGTISQGVSSALPEVEHETMTFAQEEMLLGSGIDGQLDSTYSDGGTDNEAGLGEFLARPVQIDLGGTFKALIWTVGAGIVGTSLAVLDPWTLWQANAKVKEKLKNFAYLKGKLKVRFVIAGTPFHYGRVQVSYVPFAASNEMLKQHITISAAITEGPMMYLSTCMKAELDPMSSAPVEMTLPYVHFKNWMNVAVPETLGSLYLRELVPLTRASDTAVTTIAITMFVWMEDVQLAVPTLVTPTSGREQPISSSISGISSAVASGAGKLSNVPIIGPLAKSTSIAAGAAAEVAKLLGLSRPADVTTITQNKFISESSMSFTQGASSVQKLTLDPLQEITIDPRTTGLPANDEMTFESIANRECWLTTVPWSDTGGPFTPVVGQFEPANIAQLLFVSNVTPYLCKRIQTFVGTTLLTYQTAQPTPSMLVARPFNFWRGTMVYRFRVVASNFHRGNLRVTYDPLSRNLASDTNSQMTHVIDISEARELVIRVPWCSQYPYLEVDSQRHEPPENYSPSLRNATINYAYVNYDNTRHNGVIMAQIVNQLVAPNSQPAYVVVSSWMENCEFQSPSQRVSEDYPLYVQPTSGTDIEIVKGTQSDKMSQICFGERITSLRSLLKRQTMQYSFVTTNTTNAAARYTNQLTLPQFPVYYVADSDAESKINRCSYLTLFSSAFALRRGGVRYTLQWMDKGTSSASATFQQPATAQYMRTWDSVSPGLTGSVNSSYTLKFTRILNDSNTNVSALNSVYNGFEGMYIANYGSQERIHEVEIPYYGGTRFSLSQYAPIPTADGAFFYTLSKNPAELGFQAWGAKFNMYGSRTYAPIVWSSAAEDFNLMWFIAAAPLYIAQGT